MKKVILVLIAAISAVALVGTAFAAPNPTGGPTVCDGPYYNTTISGGLVVPPYAECFLENVTVTGGTTVNGGFLLAQSSTLKGGVTANGDGLVVAFGSNIYGGLTVTGAAFVLDNVQVNGGFTDNNGYALEDVCGLNVNGAVTIENVDNGTTTSLGEANAGCAGGTINGSVTIENNPSAALEIDQYQINGDLVFTNNGPQFDELEGTTVNGSGTCTGVVNDGDGGPSSFTGSNNGCPVSQNYP